MKDRWPLTGACPANNKHWEYKKLLHVYKNKNNTFVTRNACDKRLAISRFYVHSNDDKCILFPFSVDFQAFSYRILPETSRNLSDERLKLTHVNFLQRDSDAEPTRQLINIEDS